MPVEYIPHPIRVDIQNVTGARALDVIYQNAALRPLMCIISTQHYITNAADTAMIQAEVDNVTPPVVWVSDCGLATSGVYVGLGMNTGHTTVFVVPPGFYFRMTRQIAGAGVVTLFRWMETLL